MDPPNSKFHSDVLNSVFSTIRRTNASLPTLPTTASPQDIAHALAVLPETIPEEGIGSREAIQLLSGVLSRGFSRGQSGPRLGTAPLLQFVWHGTDPRAGFSALLLGVLCPLLKLGNLNAVVSRRHRSFLVCRLLDDTI